MSTSSRFSENGGAEGSTGEWVPSDESPVSSRGRHRVLRQQRRAFARSSTVLGVGVIAAVGAGGIATAQDKAPIAISLPDGLGGSEGAAENAGLATMGGTVTGEQSEAQDGAGDALRSRILQQAEQQQAQAEAERRAVAEKAAAEAAAADAMKASADAKKKADEAKKKAAADAKKKAEADRLAKLAKSFALPTSSYNITSTFGSSGGLWSSGQHTGLDFAAPAGTPAKAVGAGTIKSAGYSGSYGYQVIIELNDGTEVMYAHLSSINANVGQKVVAGDMVGRVGSTGNSTGNHLHLEVKTPGGTTIDPGAWLRSKGLQP
ncbi:M23 family metallopeptidase [Streptomyces qinzhouensis]|uniref:M23 family metallopeptidase n=2 Tax=Streptomyces qinzhouensis TaxID=2599401 RepID=A0A5B8JIN8_9ACTN|nr:M23 family metallopeptidase [Streptomyces qinzhouensis]QDY77660.1 M23 family metallopeptidase [Streptomyces qinzhouensis]